MRIIIVGAGEVGFHLAERLSHEHQDVVVEEADADEPDWASRAILRQPFSPLSRRFLCGRQLPSLNLGLGE